MKTNELKKGTRIELANGWRATLKDNAKGNVRMALVEGTYTELGSIYSHEIAYYMTGDGPTGEWHKVEHTPSQLRLKKLVAQL